MLQTWGPDRAREVNPLDEWLAAGTDTARPINPMTNVGGWRPAAPSQPASRDLNTPSRS